MANDSVTPAEGPEADPALEITPRSEDFSRWYLELIRRTELADTTPVEGCMVIRPYGHALWENMRELLDRRLKETGHRNASFPSLIPEGLLRKQPDDVDGIASDLAWVTHCGDEELGERLAVRPTSEALVSTLYRKWVRSWRDLPLLINQWANVVRWEKVTRFFVHTTESLWQEGHTVHANAEAAARESRGILELYRTFLRDDLAIPGVTGLVSDRASFPGAERSYTVEVLTGDGRALQVGRTHDLGQNFSRAFDIRFEDRDGELRYAWQTSWGSTTRLVGAVVMSHADDEGLVLPPRVAPYQLVIVPIPGEGDAEEVLPTARRLRDDLATAGLRVHLDDREGRTAGWKSDEWVIRGVPIRAEIGPREVAGDRAVLVRRDDRNRSAVPIDHVPAEAASTLESIHGALLRRAREFLASNTRSADGYDRFRELMAGPRGYVRARWCGERGCESKIQEDTSATVRCLPDDGAAIEGECVRCGRPAERTALFAEAY